MRPKGTPPSGRRAGLFFGLGVLSFSSLLYAQIPQRPTIPTPAVNGQPPQTPAPASTSPASTTPQPTTAQPASTPTAPAESLAKFHLAGYLSAVALGNLEIVAQRANVSLATAQIEVARVFPDPQLTAGLYQYDVTQRANPTASVVALNVPLQIGGQRGARVDLANAELSAAQSDLEDFLRVLRANAAGAYVDAIHAQLVLDRREQTAQDLEKLVAVNEQRFRVGDIGESLLLQSRVEARQSRADVLNAQGGVSEATFAVYGLLGAGARNWMGRSVEFEGDLKTMADRSFDAKSLVDKAIALRPDLRAAKRRVNAAERQIDLAKANRVIDVGVGASWQHNFAVNDTTSPLPSSDFLGLTATVPLPFSRLYHGELNVAYATQSQNVAIEKSAEVRVEAEVRSAIARYQAAAARVQLYTGGVLADADKVLEKTLYNYTRGGATLVEVLVAQHTDNDVYLAYYDALSDVSHALVSLEEAIGIWDVDL
ncbi:MAG: TolC family protein [Polyangiaceae bacterium]